MRRVLRFLALTIWIPLAALLVRSNVPGLSLGPAILLVCGVTFVVLLIARITFERGKRPRNSAQSTIRKTDVLGPPSPSKIREREEALALVKTANLPDAVFAVIHYNDFKRRLGPRPHCWPIPLEILAERATEGEIAEWIRRVQMLKSHAYWLADASLGKKRVLEEVSNSYERDNPGFSSQTYTEALHLGFWDAR